ncbi:MAG: UDP-N-acetylglucosamine 2-epimerase, partial [Nitrososphaerales archaeon]
MTAIAEGNAAMRGKGKRKIAVLTGTRAEYGLLKGVMKRINEDRSLALSIIVTGTHLSRDFGYTVDEIVGDGFKIDSKIDILSKDDSGLGMALFLSRAVKEIAADLMRIRPDVLLVLGDRPEVLAAALAATYLNVPVAHVHGGDVSGSVDHPVRYAISKLCHIHFVATRQAALRLRKIGEEQRRIFVSGAPGLDEIIQGSYTAAEDLERKYRIDIKKPLLLLLQHPVVTEQREAAHQMIQTLGAV